jgi:deoxyribodipyrimidine photo-lyase
MASPSIVWFRDDLRLADHPALRAAIDRGEPVIALYLLDEESSGIRPLGGAARWWLHHSLASLSDVLGEKGAPLVLRRGAASDVLPALVAEVGAGAVFWNRRYSQPERDIDARLKTSLREAGVTVESFAASVLFEPWTVKTGGGTPFAVFSPFWRACLALPAPRAPLAEPRKLVGFDGTAETEALDDWNLLPTRPDWAAGFRERWVPGEAAARQRLAQFIDTDLSGYDRSRDEPATGATSMLSPRLRWGELSPYQIWHAAVEAGEPRRFLSELGWREFAWHTLFHHPDLATVNLRREFDAFPWPPLDDDRLRAWQRGETGIALVDAGMKELWVSGWMHNRVRMVTASFLIKNLLIDWRLGEEWFWDTLVDADAANNAFSWQWVAGSGADAAPYFRVFNPELQAEKFDPRREYIRRWAPEHASGEAPEPIVDLKASRAAALAAYEKVKRG